VLQLLRAAADTAATNDDKMGPLHYAAASGHEASLQFLLERRAEV
jgi:ankyrin repeat protein